MMFFQLHAVNLNAPRIGRFIQNDANFRVDNIARGQRVVKLHITDDISQRCCRKVLNRGDRALHAVSIQLRVCDLEIHHRVDLHRERYPL